ncbi:hypothetical protein DMUE_1388, partial [Dictyocoela muelleri]
MENVYIEKSQRGNLKLYLDDYIYNLQKKTAEYIYWRCVRRNFSGRFHSDLAMKEFIKKSLHWHEPERQKVIRNKFYKQLYSSENSNFDDALNKSLLTLQENEITCLPPLKNIRDYYTRKS